MNLYFSREIRQNDALRGAYNALTERTFGFSFEAWYRMGYWGDFHVPYALFDGGRAVANVSVNRMEVLFDGAVRQCFQLGTVMTDPACRRRGYAAEAVERVIRYLFEETDTVLVTAGAAAGNAASLALLEKLGFTREGRIHKGFFLPGEGAVDLISFYRERNT